jgi:hypothetical protein
MNLIVLCAVCFNGAEPVMRDSLNAGILVLLGVTAVVLAAFAAFFVRLARAARRVPEMTADTSSLIEAVTE